MRLMMKSFGLAAVLLSMTACGVTYQSPSIRQKTDASDVRVVSLTTSSVGVANSSPYIPRSLPEVFYIGTGGATVQSVGAVPPPPFIPEEEADALELRLPPPASEEPYRIGVGDVLLLATKSAASTLEEISGLLAIQNQRQGFTVRDDGAIAIPDVGTVSVAGRTVEEAETELFNTLVSRQIDPSFSLEIAEFNSKKIAIGGAVRSPTLVPVTLNTVRLGSAITAAGGISASDLDFATIRLYRGGSLYQIPVNTYLESASIRDTILTNGDAVFVDTTYDLDRALQFYQQRIDVINVRQAARSSALSELNSEISLRREALNEQRTNFKDRVALDAVERDYVYLSGEVAAQNRVPLPFGQQATLADVLYGNGGFSTETGDPAQIYVLRASQGSVSDEVVAWHLDATNPANLTIGTRFQMRPNDVVFIEEQQITKWSRALRQLFPPLINAAVGSVQ